MNIPSRASLLPLLACTLAVAPLQGATLIWDGGGTTDNWTDANNWNTNAVPANPVPPADADVLQFAGTTRLNPKIGAATWYASQIQFNNGAGAFTLGDAANRSTITLRPQMATGHDSNHFLINSSTNTQIIEDNLVVRATGTDNDVGSGISADQGNIIINGNIELGAKFSGLRLKAGAGKTLTINGILSGAPTGATAINNSGTVILSNANNSYTNSTIVYNGTLKITANALSGVNGALGNSTTTVTMAANTDNTSSYSPRLIIGAAATIGRNIDLTTRTTGTGTNSFTIGGDSAHDSYYTGIITNSTSGTATAAANALTVTAESQGKVHITQIRRVSTTTANNDSVTKTGLGIVALTGTGSSASNYAGATNVTQGTLLVNGTLSGTTVGAPSVGGVIVSTAAALGGSGRIDRAVAVNSNAIFTPGDMTRQGVSQAGTLTVGGNLTFQAGSILNYDLGTTLSDTTVVTGLLTLRGQLNILDSGGFTNGPGIYKLFDYGTLDYTAGQLSINNTPDNSFTYSIDISTPNSVYLIVVPEPGRALLCLAGGLGLLLIRRRRAVS